MYRVGKLSGTWYAKEFDDLSDEEDNILAFVNDGVPVIISQSVEEVAEVLEIGVDEIVVVEDED